MTVTLPAANCVDLGPGPRPERVVHAMADEPGLVCLIGDWAGGSALLTSRPVRRRQDVDLGEIPRSTSDEFGGGWFGTVPYGGVPDFAFHDHVVRLVDGRWRFEALPVPGRELEQQQALARWRAALEAADATGAPWEVGQVEVPPAAEHLARVERAVELIRAGELYQVNACTRLSAAFAGSPAGLFADLVAALRPARAALMTTSRGAVVSLSPELFLSVRGRTVRTAPIKGTLPRDGSPATADNDRRLRASSKDVAENVMIVDLVRNDLGRVCETGSVRVRRLLDVQAHPGVWHLVSEVVGRLRPDVGWAGLLDATAPPGSVTGAPKIRAMRAIDELEASPRGVYTGAVGCASPLWGGEWNVAIRTFEIGDGRVELGVGGGITADSVPMLEWRECLHKAAPLLRAAARPVVAEPEPSPPVESKAVLETVLVRAGEAVRLADHLARLDRSCRELFGTAPELDRLAKDVRDTVAEIADRAVLRLTSDGSHVDLHVAPLGAAPPTLRLRTVVRAGGLWRHKWADRSRFAADESDVAPDAPLYVAADGTVLETSRGNVFLVQPDRSVVTPPLRDDLLPGVTRRALLDLARDHGIATDLRGFDVAELMRAPAFWTSSLRGAVPIHAVDGIELPRADELVARLAAALVGGETHNR